VIPKQPGRAFCAGVDEIVKNRKNLCCYPTANESVNMLAVWERPGQGENGAVVWPGAGWEQVAVGQIPGYGVIS
jgi:hypothetical protein